MIRSPGVPNLPPARVPTAGPGSPEEANGVRSAQSTLAVDVQVDPADPTTTVIRLDGELDITSSALLQTVVDQALSPRRVPRTRLLVLEMSGVSFADAAGLSPILLARALLRKNDGRLELRHSRRAVLRVLRILGLTDLVAEAESDTA
jgi:anti-anti-sigma factor